MFYFTLNHVLSSACVQRAKTFLQLFYIHGLMWGVAQFLCQKRDRSGAANTCQRVCICFRCLQAARRERCEIVTGE